MALVRICSSEWQVQVGVFVSGNFSPKGVLKDNNTMQLGSRVFVSLLALAFFVTSVPAATYIPDSPITGIVVPYRRTVQGFRSLTPRSADGGAVMAKSLNRDNQLTVMVSGPKGTPVNFADGAYPVYYMPGNVNGKFNGKISLLT